jgi:ADP-heptose:LPS heptosyltransferase
MVNNSFISDRSEIKKIAVFRALYLGDMLCIIPAVRAVREALPSATIILVGLGWQDQFVKRFSRYFDDFIDFPGWQGLPEQEVNERAANDFVKRMRSEQFDLVLQMHGNGFITNDLCAMWNPKYLCGLRSKYQPVPEKGLFPISEDDDHEVTRFLKISNALGFTTCGTELEFNITQEEFLNFKNMQGALSLKTGSYICVHAGARDVKRRWPVDNFAFVANHLARLGHRIVLTGSIQEKELLESLQKRISYPVVNIVEYYGNVGLGELACFIRHANLLISNDTGVSHIAAALKIPSVIIFSSYSNIGRWAPLDQHRHLAIPPEKSNDPEYVLNLIQDQLVKYSTQQSPVLFN